MAHHDQNSVNWLWRGFKTSAAEPFASMLGEKLGAYFLTHPAITGLLDGVSSDWRSLLSTAVKAGGGVAEIPGKGPVIYIINEALDAFIVGLGRSLQDLKDKSPDEIANDLFAISALESATKRLEEVLASEVIINGKWFHMTGCPEARGRQKMTMRDAVAFAYLPMNCRCLGSVFNVPTEEEESPKAPPVEVFTIIELVRALMEDAETTENTELFARVVNFRKKFTTLSEVLRLKFEYLAKEKRAKEKLALLIGYSEEEWESVADAMLDDPIQARADGVIKTMVGGLGKIGDRIAKKFDAEGIEAGNLLTSIEEAIAADTEKRLEAREVKSNEESLSRVEAEKNKPRVDFMAVTAYASFVALILTIIFVAIH